MKAELAGVRWTPDCPDQMVFTLKLPRHLFQEITCVQDRAELAGEIMTALEQACREHHAFVNKLRTDVQLAPHEFDYPVDVL
jgi:hypothetical protein